MASPNNKHRFLLALVLFFLDASVSVAARLSLPVELTVENGDYKNCTVHLTKNGSDVGIIAGKSMLHIKLDFNNVYELMFCKPGYITKKIEVNTTVAPGNEQQAFEPYKIGVKLFKQYEGINIVVYSQPVAKIKFNPVIDDFDYDVDYTKSILSKLNPVEQELEVRAAEERKMIASGELPKEGYQIPASSSERFAHYPNINGGKETLTLGQKPQNDSSVPIYPSIDPIDNALLNGGADLKNPSLINNGSDSHPANEIFKGVDQKNKSLNAEGTNIVNGDLNSDNGDNKSKVISGSDNFDAKGKKDADPVFKNSISNTFTKNSGSDIGTINELLSPPIVTKTREFIIEPNRTITTIKINEGQNAVLYRKVLYNWGGLYYFKNLSFSISQNLFELGTGEK